MTRTQFVVTNLHERKQKDFNEAAVSRTLSKFKQRELTPNLVKIKITAQKLKEGINNTANKKGGRDGQT